MTSKANRTIMFVYRYTPKICAIKLMISLEIKCPQLRGGTGGVRGQGGIMWVVSYYYYLLLPGGTRGTPRALPSVLLDTGSGQSSGGDGLPPAAPPAARLAPQGPLRSRLRDAEGGAGRCARAAHPRVPRVHPGLRRSGQRLHSLPTLLRRWPADLQPEPLRSRRAAAAADPGHQIPRTGGVRGQGRHMWAAFVIQVFFYFIYCYLFPILFVQLDWLFTLFAFHYWLYF